MDLEVKILIALKAQYKLASGVDWEPPSATGASAAPATASSGAAAVDKKVVEQVCLFIHWRLEGKGKSKAK